MTLAQMKSQARRWVPWWRDRLGLRDWHIDVVYMDPIDAGEAVGHCRSDFAERKAVLSLAAPTTPGARERWNDVDLESTIVHELLHIHFFSIGVGGGKYDPSTMSKTVMVEQVINTLADCLVALRRGRHRR
jgi:hypothetical protein